MSATLIPPSAPKTRPATPGLPRSPSPTTQTMAQSSSTWTSPSRASSAAIAGSGVGSSTVSETLTSEVATMSTGVRWRSKTSKIARRKPYAPSMRADVMRSTVTPRLCAIALIPSDETSRRASMIVPGASGSWELQMRTGISRSTAGWIVRGCSTFAPK